LKLPSGIVDVPRLPVDIPSALIPFGRLISMSPECASLFHAQLLCKLNDPHTLVFFAWPGIAPEFAFEDKDGFSIESVRGKLVRERGPHTLTELSREPRLRFESVRRTAPK